MAHVVSITYTPKGVDPKPGDHYARVAAEAAVLREGRGIEGDIKGRGGKRQINVMLADVIEELRAEGFDASPGELGEQLVIGGLSRGDCAEGTRLRIGDSAVIELGEPRTGCDRFENIQGRPRKSVEGRLGYLARVVCGGEIRVGSSVEPAP